MASRAAYRYSLLALFALVPSSFAVEPATAYLERHCIGCHDADTKSGGLDLQSIASKPIDAIAFDMWVKIHDRIQSGEMPPPKKPRPPKADTDPLLQHLDTSLSAIQRKQREKDGRTVIRRLNRAEYENTLRDLFDLPGLNVKDMLPDDGRAFGYDKSAAALDISPVLLAKYGEVADVVLDAAIAQWLAPPVPFKERMYAHRNYDFGVVIPNGDGVILKDLKYDDSRFPIPNDKYAGGKFKGLGELEASKEWKEPGTTGLFRCLGESFPGRFSQFSPVIAGRYKLSTSVWSFWWDKGEVKALPRTGAAGIYYGSRVLGFFDAPSLKPTPHQFEAWLEPGEHLKFDPASLWEVHVYHRQGKAAGFTGPGIAIDYLDVEGPVFDQWPTTSHKRLFGELPLIAFDKLDKSIPKPKREMPRQNTRDGRNPPGPLTFATIQPSNPQDEAEKLLKAFLPRAFRRPVTAEEVSRFHAIAIERLAAKLSFEDAMRAAYKTILCSPEFLFLRETIGPLDDFAIASRLSYFLWNSMPDDALITVASTGKLRDPKELRSQTDRMLNDPKSQRFVSDFLDQWLDLREFDLTTPDRKLYPEFNPYLRDAIRQEPRVFLRELIQKNLPSVAVVQSDFAMLNQRLAEHYRIPGIEGTTFRRVELPKDSHRGGLITQAAILKVTANGTTTSPVKRGAWVQRKIVGNPPQPPPPNITAVEPDVRGATTIREQLSKHRDNASCASCHAKMDPPGFALESYDVIGGFRDQYRATQGKIRPDFVKEFPSHLNPGKAFPTDIYHVGFSIGLPVDASGEMLDGRKFAGIDEFRTLLAKNPRVIARNLARQLTIYATGAPVEFADRQMIERVLDQSGAEFPVRSLIHEIVQSPLFLQK